MFRDPLVKEILMDITNDGESSVPIIECIMNGKTFDEEIAEETDIRLNTVRKILYKLHDAGVANYKRSRDPETNWYIYSWKFDEDKISEIISKKFEKYSEDIEKSLEYEEENMFFICKANGHRYLFEEATENNFVCPECQNTLEYQDNSTIIQELKHMLKTSNKS